MFTWPLSERAVACVAHVVSSQNTPRDSGWHVGGSLHKLISPAAAARGLVLLFLLILMILMILMIILPPPTLVVLWKARSGKNGGKMFHQLRGEEEERTEEERNEEDERARGREDERARGGEEERPRGREANKGLRVSPPGTPPTGQSMTAAQTASQVCPAPAGADRSPPDSVGRRLRREVP